VAGAVTAMLQRWAWYAARREGLHLDEAIDDFADPDLTAAAVRTVAPTLHLGASAIDAVVRDARLERYGAGETVQPSGSVPDSMRLILAGRAQLTVAQGAGGPLLIGALGPGDYLGQTALTREKVTAGVVAIDELTVLRVPVAVVDALVHGKPELAREIGKSIDLRRQRVVDAIRVGTAAQLVVAAAVGGSASLRGAW